MIINELTAKLKAAAKDAADNFDPVIGVFTRDVLALTEALEAAEKRNAELMEKQRLIDICQGQGLEHRIAAEKRAEAAEKRNAELEQSELQLIGERDDAEAALADMYEAATGERPEWSNWFSFDDAVESVSEKVGVWLDRIKQVDSANAVLAARIAELESREVKLSKLSVDEVMHLSGFSRDYAEGWCAGNDNARHEIQVAGIRLGGLR